jgi:hypothetical protein
MKLYTICVDQRPILVMSVDAGPLMPDQLTTNAEPMKARRDIRALSDSLPADVQRINDQREIDEALNTWLGQDLRTLRSHGVPLWSGGSASLLVRDATPHEAQGWHETLQREIDTDEEDAGDEDWLVYLVPIHGRQSRRRR